MWINFALAPIMNDQMDTEPAVRKTLLLVDDEQSFLRVLARNMDRRGFTVYTAGSLAEAQTEATRYKPNFAVVDMKLGDGHGLDLVPQLREINPDMRIVMLTGFGNLATAVAAIKMGALDYLSKPADPDDIEAALLVQGDKPTPPDQPMSADRVRWEHIQRIYELCDRNVSETARRLNMHRRTLQRILAKHSPR